MADTRALTRVLNRVKQLEAYSAKNLSNEPLETIKANISLLKDEWNDYQAKTYSDTPDTIALQDQLETKFFNIKSKLITAELSMIPSSLHPPELDSSLSELMANQRSFLQEVSNMNNKTENDVRLPRVNIPFFSGMYSEFSSFRDLFEASIHSNTKMSKVHKLQYLKGLLKGEAYALIRHVAITDANYEEAWQMIINRYDKKKHLITTLLKQFMEQPTITQVSAKSLHHMHDVSDEVLRGIKVLGEEYQSRDPWLIYILVSKLEANIKQAWAQHSYGIDSPKIEQFFEFFKKQGDTLECCEPLKRPAQRHTQNCNIKVMHTATNIVCCPKCSSGHYLRNCDEFMKLSTHERRGFVADNKLCFICLYKNHLSQNCRSRYRCSICKAKHHTSLHLENNLAPSQKDETFSEPSSSTSAASEQFVETKRICHIRSIKTFTSILPTAVIKVLDAANNFQRCRVLLDSGAQASFISESCAQRLRLPRTQAKIIIKGITSGQEVTRGKLSIDAVSIYSDSQRINLEVLILKKLTGYLPSRKINSTDLSTIQNLPLADPHFSEPQTIDIIIGADKFFSILREGCITQFSDRLIAQNSIFGWIISGEAKNEENNAETISLNYHIDIDHTLRRFWEMEEILTVKSLSQEESTCEEYFKSSTIRDENGKYIVKLPFKNPRAVLGNSLHIAKRRFFNLEKKFNRNPRLKNEYIKVMREYITLNHMQEIPYKDQSTHENQVYYLPHHSVTKEESTTTKLRVVFDGSCKTANGISINEALMIGPTIQPTLWTTLMKFRYNKIAITADIEKMYRQVLVDENDRNFQRILWREHEDDNIKHYKLNTVTFGMSSSAFLATRSLQQAAFDCAETYPLISNEILEKFYIDDYLSGSNSVEEAIFLKNTLNKILKERGFMLRKWRSNIKELLDYPTEKEQSLVPTEDGDYKSKVLGLQWNTTGDHLSFKFNLPIEIYPTKRSLLSNAAKVFDPLGLVSPSIVIAKILYQKVWLRKLDWDDKLPDDICILWNQLKIELGLLEQLKIKRFINKNSMQLHGFCDASERAYAAVVYGRYIDENGHIQIELLASKTKVAPIRQISLPRLELCGAHLLAKLLQEVKKIYKEEREIIAWSDSTIVLAWLSDHPVKWKTFVANRVSEIQQLLPRSHWRHVKSEDNPADYASRGILPSKLILLHQWWHGPPWLAANSSTWPIINKEGYYNDTVCEKKKEQSISLFQISKTANNDGDTFEMILNKVSSFSKAIRIICFINRFIQRARKINKKTQTLALTVNEIKEATEMLVKWVQKGAFYNEIQTLVKNGELNKNNKLSSLTPFVDKNGILRIGGRLKNTNYLYDFKHPIILPKSHILSRMIISFFHIKYLHPGPSHTFHLIRQTYWIVQGRSVVRNEINKCIQCFKSRATTSKQLMGDLPSVRVTPAKPFANCGVDYAGPILLASKRGRGAKVTKGYIAIFVCMVTKAIHIEAVTDLTTEAFIAALKRFAARRSSPNNIYSDNGSNFIGAARHLKEVYKFHNLKINDYIITEYCAQNQINWHHIPPSAPNFGGLWESAVKSTKTHITRVTANSHLTYEEMATLLSQIESVLNSRPLCPMSEDDDSFEALTPAHFLIGSSLVSIPDYNFDESTTSRLSKWQQIEQLLQSFWKRFHYDYINSLQQRNKWKTTTDNMKTGDLVLIKNENIPSCKWAMGRIIETHPDDYGNVRVVTVKTASNIIKRSITKICKLPVDS